MLLWVIWESIYYEPLLVLSKNSLIYFATIVNEQQQKIYSAINEI